MEETRKKHTEVILDITKGAIYTKIRDYMEMYKKEDFKTLCASRTIKGFIDRKVEYVYEQMQISVSNGFSQNEAYELVLDDIYFK